MQNKNYFDRLKQKRKEDIPLQIKGQIEDIIFQNEINGYTICTLQTEEDEMITAVGYLPFMHSGDTVKLVGKYVTHQEYGEQFKIDTFEKILPETLEGLEKYLASGNVKGNYIHF